MFNLEQTITKWRQQMAASGIKDTAVLDELESHLREDVERQVRTGLNEERAAAAAVERIGQSGLLKAEFAKISEMKEARPAKVIGIACGLAALPFSVFAVPNFLAIPELGARERLLGSAAVALTFLSLASWRFSHKFLPVIRNRRVRLAASIACGAMGLAGLGIFGLLLPTVIVPHMFSDWNAAQTGELRPVFAMGVLILWVMTFTAVLGGVAYGLEETARRKYRNETYA